MALHAVQVSASTKRANNPPSTPSPSHPYPNSLHSRMTKNIMSHIMPEMDKWNQPFSSVTTSGSNRISYMRSMYRCSTKCTKSELVNSISSSVVPDSKWAKIEYHLCTHDEESGGGCPSWSVEHSHGNVPNGV